MQAKRCDKEKHSHCTGVKSAPSALVWTAVGQGMEAVLILEAQVVIMLQPEKW